MSDHYQSQPIGNRGGSIVSTNSVTSNNSQISKDNEPNRERSSHLFVLIHGLWGGPNHMSTIERALKESLTSVTDDKIVTLKPSSFRFWKTYDGLKLNAERVVTDIFYEIETLKNDQNYKVDKISIVGYSLGGLIARYVVGILEELQFFQDIEPMYFTTFATPHVGVEFFNENFFDRTANKVGQYLFGKSGRQLFLTDHEHIVLQMSQPDSFYYQGLIKFKKHILLANIKNDRTVAFFTSYITEYSPFDQWDSIKVKYLKDLPQSRIGKIYVKPKIVDFSRTNQIDTETDISFKGNVQEATSFFRSNKLVRLLIIVLGASVLLPVWIPLVLISSLTASIYSMIKIKLMKPPEIDKHWIRVKQSVFEGGPINQEDAKTGEERRKQRDRLAQHESFKGDTSELTENTMENILYAEERLTGKSADLISNERDGNDDEYIDSGKGVEDKSNQVNNDDGTNLSQIPEVESSADDSANDDTSIPIKEIDDADVNVNESSASTATIPKLSILSTFTGRYKKKVDIKTELNDKMACVYTSTLKSKHTDVYPLFNDKTKLKLKEDKLTIIENLNKIDWIKIPVYLDAFNAHDGIISRRGKYSSPKGVCNIYFWTSILRNHLNEPKKVE